MGITTYLFHRSEDLDAQRFNMFFLDMGENIHFHYRDLRIELSVPEFVELAGLFNDYAKQVLREIDAGYRDGVLANTNETETLKTFWDKDRPLVHPVAYHEKDLAIEETKEGYHLHIRNYKILLSKESFTAFAHAMAETDLLLRRGTLVRDPLQLLEQNELEPRLLNRTSVGEQDELIIAVAKTYRKKAFQVLRAIGFQQEDTQPNGHTFSRGKTRVLIVDPTVSQPAVRSATIGAAEMVSLPRFLAAHGAELDANQLNTLKLRILFLLKQSANGHISPFRLQDLYINRETLTPAVDLFASPPAVETEAQIEAFSKLLVSHKLFFIKPNKQLLAPDQSAAVHDAFFRFVNESIACHEYVRKIILIGSSTNKRLGRYEVPFIHFDWAKINSDFDIYVELEPDYQGPFPESWHKKFYWSRAGSDYYHFGDIGNGMSSELAKTYPGLCFYEHLVEGYLFDYRRGDRKKRDAWLKELKGHCIFRRDKIADWVRRHYPIQAVETEPFTVASFNQVHLVRADADSFVLKRYSDRYLSSKEKQRVSYEIELLDALKDSSLEIALPIRNKSGSYISRMEKDQAVLFSFVPGEAAADPSEPQVRAAGRMLARFHLAAQPLQSKRARRHSNKEPLLYWSKAWEQYQADAVVGTDVTLDAAVYRNRLERLNTPAGHCHGDLSVVNYLFEGDRCRLIDFQNICYGPLVVDLANGMIEFCARKNAFLDANLSFFRQGYEEVRPLSEEEDANLVDLLILQAIVRQAKLIRLHFGGFGYDLKTERLLGLQKGLKHLLGTTADQHSPASG